MLRLHLKGMLHLVSPGAVEVLSGQQPIGYGMGAGVGSEGMCRKADAGRTNSGVSQAA